MSSSFTVTGTTTFTLTHAKYMAAKVATDLKRVQRFYGDPSDARIANYEAEVTELLKGGYLGTLTLGFKRNEQWIVPTLRYKASDLAGSAANDDDPGRVPTGANISGATFYSYLTYSTFWNALSEPEKDAFKRRLPFQRTGADQPGLDGYLVDDLTYTSGGRAIKRSSLRGY
jgi:hypothetical protein